MFVSSRSVSKLVITLLAGFLLTGAIVFAADGFKAWDTSLDNPDGVNKWFAPNSVTHNMAWWDNDGSGREDYIYDTEMQWNTNQFAESKALAHEVRTDHLYYEASSYLWTNLPNIDHSEDSSELEEFADGYEERELGTTRPETIVPGNRYTVITGYVPLQEGNTYFESESELNKTAGWSDLPCTPGSQWCPEDWDRLGRLNALGIQ